MIQLSHDSPLFKIEKLQPGDQVIDSYNTTGKIVKILRCEKQDFIEFRLVLENRQTIFLMIG